MHYSTLASAAEHSSQSHTKHGLIVTPPQFGSSFANARPVVPARPANLAGTILAHSFLNPKKKSNRPHRIPQASSPFPRSLFAGDLWSSSRHLHSIPRSLLPPSVELRADSAPAVLLPPPSHSSTTPPATLLGDHSAP